MKRIVLLCSFIALGSSPALARPWVYLSSFSHGGTGEQCLGAARIALANAGFTRDVYTRIALTARKVDLLKPYSPIHLCVPKLNVIQNLASPVLPSAA